MHTTPQPDADAIRALRQALHALVDQLPPDLGLLEAYAALLRYRPQPQPPRQPDGQPEPGG